MGLSSPAWDTCGNSKGLETHPGFMHLSIRHALLEYFFSLELKCTQVPSGQKFSLLWDVSQYSVGCYCYLWPRSIDRKWWEILNLKVLSWGKMLSLEDACKLPIFLFCSHCKCDSVENTLVLKFLYVFKHVLNVDKATGMNKSNSCPQGDYTLQM